MSRAIVFANGDLPEPELTRQRLRADDLILAADGGSRHCRALGLIPHAVIGDLDSISPEARAAFEQAGARLVVHPTHKDETDLELALLYAAQQGATHLAVLGALGGRLDMSFANLLLLAHPQLAALRVELWHGAQTAWLIRPPGEAVTGQPGDTLSLIPLNGAAEGIATHGLQYPLDDETLTSGPARGLSNVLFEGAARVELRAGLLLAVHTPGRA